MKRKAGRPKKAKGETRVPGISVRLTAEERKTLDGAISNSGLSQSDWARKGLLYLANNRVSVQ